MVQGSQILASVYIFVCLYLCNAQVFVLRILGQTSSDEGWNILQYSFIIQLVQMMSNLCR